MKTLTRIILVAMVLSVVVGIFTACCSTDDNKGYNNAENFDSVNFSFETAEGEKKTVLIHLDFDGGYAGNSSAVTVGRFGEQIEGLPLKISKIGFTFSGWYTSPNCSGYQVADQNELITDRSILNSKIYGLTEESETLTLYAGWVREKIQLSLILESVRFPVETEYGEYLSEISLGKNITALTYSINPSGYPLFTAPITENMDLYVVSYEKTFSGTSTCCKVDNGFNPAVSGDQNDIKLHKGWELGEIYLQSEQVNASETEYTLNYKLLQNIYHLPTTSLDGLHDVWMVNDTFSEKIYNTNLKNQQVGFGAYYVKVTYESGRKEEFNGTNFLASLSQFDTTEFCSLTVKKSNRIKRIDVSVFYEVRRNASVSYWLGVNWLSNYRCDFQIKL